MDFKKLRIAKALILLIQLLKLSYSIPIDNGVTGSPTVQCEMDRISISVKTEKPFLGRIFVKGQSKQEECRRDFLNNDRPEAMVYFMLSSCGMKRERKLAPQPGLEQSITVIVSFHYVFVTKVDKAYSIDCFYGEQNFAMVTHNILNVSMIPTESLSDSLGIQPECIYEVRRHNIDGPTAVYAEVGDKLFHRWTCAATGPLRMLVKSCAVSDGNGEFFTIVDDRGCAVDPVVLTDLTYVPEENFAFVESHAFKFADTAFLGFSCTVQVCSPVQDPACQNLSPPVCSVEGQPYAIVQSRRRFSDEPLPLLRDELDVSAPAMNILEPGLYLTQRPHTDEKSHSRFRDGLKGKINLKDYPKTYQSYDDQRPFYAVPNYLAPPSKGEANSGDHQELTQDSVCIRKFIFGMMTIVLFGLLIILGSVCMVLYASLRKTKPKNGKNWWINQ